MLGGHHREPVASRTVFSRTAFAGVPQASPVPACPAWPKRRAAGREKGRNPECEFHVVPKKNILASALVSGVSGASLELGALVSHGGEAFFGIILF